MRSREDLVVMVREVFRHPMADLLCEIGLEESSPTQAAQRAQREGFSNEEEKLVKRVAVFERDYSKGWFRALREMLVEFELQGGNLEMGLTEAQKRVLKSIKQEYIQEAVDVLTSRLTGDLFVTLNPAFDPQKVKEEHFGKLVTTCGTSQLAGERSFEHGLLNSIGMTFEDALKRIPDPEPGYENYLLVVNCLPLAKLMRFVIVDGKRGRCLVNENEIEDVVEVPKTLFYWRYDISDMEESIPGGDCYGVEELLERKKRDGRQLLTVREAICFAIADLDTISGYCDGILCAGSSLEKEFVPVLTRFHDRDLGTQKDCRVPFLYYTPSNFLDSGMNQDDSLSALSCLATKK